MLICSTWNTAGWLYVPRGTRREFIKPSPSASPPPVSLRLGHTRGLTTHRVVIQDPRAASLPRGRGSRTNTTYPRLSLRESSREAGERAYKVTGRGRMFRVKHSEMCDMFRVKRGEMRDMFHVKRDGCEIKKTPAFWCNAGVLM